MMLRGKQIREIGNKTMTQYLHGFPSRKLKYSFSGRECCHTSSVVWESLELNAQDLISVIHYDDVIMGAIASQITSLTIIYSTVYLDADQRKHQSSASLAFVWGIHRVPVNSPHKWPVTRKCFHLMTSS